MKKKEKNFMKTTGESLVGGLHDKLVSTQRDKKHTLSYFNNLKEGA